MVYNGYYKVMSNIPKMGHLTTPVQQWTTSIQFGSAIPENAKFLQNMEKWVTDSPWNVELIRLQKN